jgi:hypothetical protein
MRSNPTATITFAQVEARLSSMWLNFSKVKFMTSWLKQPKNNCTSDQLQRFLLSTKYGIGDGRIGVDDLKPFLIYTWLTKRGNESNYSDVGDFVSSMIKVKNKSSLLLYWLTKPENNTLDNFKRLFKLIEDEYFFSFDDDNTERDNFIKIWFEHQRDDFSLNNLKQCMGSIRDARHRLTLAKLWLAKKPENNTPNNAKEILSLIRNGAGYRFLTRPRFFPGSYDDCKEDFLKFCLSKIGDQNKRHDYFVELVKLGVFSSLYNQEAIQFGYTSMGLPKEKIPNLCRDLYPTHEAYRVEIFNEFLKKGSFTRENLPIVSGFIKSIEDDGFALSVLKTAKASRALGLKKTDILELATNRVGTLYQSLTESLRGKGIKSLTAKGLADVKKEFRPQSIPEGMNLASLFSYYDLQEGVAGIAKFRSMLEPSALRELTENFTPSIKKPYISKVEKAKLVNLLGEEATAESFPKTEVLSNYLQAQTPEIPRLDAARIDSFSFGRSDLIDGGAAAKERAEITESFKELLRADKADQEAVFNFFKDIKCVDNTVNADNRGKIAQFFNTHKTELAFLFAKENGVNDFASTASGILSTLSDGCAANIGTQFNNALLHSLLKDSGPNAEYNKVLYSVFIEKIVTPFFNEADHVHAEETEHMRGANVLNHPTIKRELLLSPTGLVERIKHEFCTEVDKHGVPKHNINPTPILEANFTPKVMAELNDESTKNPRLLSEIATYLVLQKTIPDLLNNKHLTGFKERCEEVIKAAQDESAKEADLSEVSASVAEAPISEIVTSHLSSADTGAGVGIAFDNQRTADGNVAWPIRTTVVATTTATKLSALPSQKEGVEGNSANQTNDDKSAVAIASISNRERLFVFSRGGPPATNIR